ncbi:hypothetical protein ACFWSF_24230 [Streptomyces sp. NPDC058611]|uniref:hypothetical protein n=1 Tax=unclassified Streptomyces TaxID=2593676 RepID=UPI00365822EE
MLNDVITSSIGELLGGLALVLLVTLATWALRHRSVTQLDADPDTTPVPAARTYTLIGSRAPDGDPVQLVSTRPTGTVITQRSPRGRQQFELTGAVLSDGTYAAEPLARYR